MAENEYYEGMYQLTMPGQPVTVSAVFVPEPEEVPEFGPASFILPAALTTIEKSAFEGNPMMTIVDTNHCTSIGKDAFKDCAKLTQIKLPENCQINPEAFNHPVYVFTPADGLTKECCDAQNNLIFVEIPET